MAGRPGLDPMRRGKSYSALFVLMVALLLVVAMWAIWDDNISRRPWKEYQVEFDRLAYNKYMQDVADEQKKLDANPEYIKTESRNWPPHQREISSGDTAATSSTAARERSEVGLKIIADEKEQAVRFTKSMLTERWYDYNHAIQMKQDPAPSSRDHPEAAQGTRCGKRRLPTRPRRDLQDVKDQIDAINSQVVRSTEKLKVLNKTRDDLMDKADTYMIPIKFMGRVIARYPKIPKIQQTAIDDFDRNAFDEAIARVDRCQSCHMGDDKKGFENAPQPFRTHSNFDAII